MMEANVSKTEIDFISLHGTATSFNDEMEAQALYHLNLSDVACHSLKAYFGHTLGAAGLIESAMVLQMLKTNTTLASKGFKELGTAVALNVEIASRKKEIETVLKTGSGFGGCNAALVFSKQANLQFPNEPISKIKGEINSRKTLKGVRISPGAIEFQNQQIYSENYLGNPSEWLNSAFRSLCGGYLKFFKMDNLSKLGFLTAELLMVRLETSKVLNSSEIAIVLANRSSSLDTDLVHQDSINDKQNYFPSPSVFVYTLPNIVMGEIAIRHNIKGENLFLVMPEANWEQLENQVAVMLTSALTKAVLFGWVELLGNDFYAEMYWVDKSFKV
jgi:3-oxoacyl-(acyl-carrier-protein) synthase